MTKYLIRRGIVAGAALGVTSLATPATADELPIPSASADFSSLPSNEHVVVVDLAKLESELRARNMDPAPAIQLSRSVRQGYNPYISREEAIRLEIIFQALNALDWGTTAHCMSRESCVEGNPIWGENPDLGKMALIKIGVGALHAAYSYFLYENAPRVLKPFQYSSIVVYSGVVAWNLQFAF